MPLIIDFLILLFFWALSGLPLWLIPVALIVMALPWSEWFKEAEDTPLDTEKPSLYDESLNEVVIHDIDKDYTYTKEYCSSKGYWEIQEEILAIHYGGQDVYDAIGVILDNHWYTEDKVVARFDNDCWAIDVDKDGICFPPDEVKTKEDVEKWFKENFTHSTLTFKA